MSSAGQQLVAGRIPGERIATVVQTSDSTLFTAETLVMSIEAPLVIGRTYRVTADLIGAGSVAGDNTLWRIRQDLLAGTQMQQRQRDIPSTGFGWLVRMEAEFTATATAAKTFVVTGERLTGTGNIRIEAAADRPAYLYVDYIRG